MQKRNWELKLKLKTTNGYIQLDEWVKVKDCYWLRQDLAELNSDWAKKVGSNNLVIKKYR